jgi:hypothetical protein
MNTCYVVRSSCPAGLFSFGLLDGLQVRLRRPYLREAQADFGLERLATSFMNNPGQARENFSDRVDGNGMIMTEQAQPIRTNRLRKSLVFVQCPVAILRMEIVPE